MTDGAPMRRGVIALAAATIAGLAAELVIERHWGTPVRLVPWLTLGLLAWAVYAVARPPTPRTLRAARAIAYAGLAASALGIALHINENYQAGPLDFRFQDRWDAMSEPDRWWTAFTKSVGPAPTFAPAALAEVSLLVLIAAQGRGGAALAVRPRP